MPVPAPKTFAMPPQHIRAAIVPSTLDEAKRTVEIVWSTGERRRVPGDWYTDPHFEQLSLDPAHVDLNRLNDGAAVLDAHGMNEFGQPLPGGGKCENIIGVVERAWIDPLANGEFQARALVRFSQRDEEVEKRWKDVKDGILRNVSIGYRVFTWRDITEPEDDLPVLLAIRWAPHEISFLPVGQDAGASVRSAAHFHTCEVVTDESRAMPTKKKTPADPANPDPQGGTRGADPNPNPDPVAGGSPDPAPGAGAPDPGDTRSAEELETARMEGQALEFRRAEDIKAAVEKAGLTRAFADDLIKQKVDIDKARSMIIDKLAGDGEGSQVSTQVRVGDDGDERTRALAVENAILHRIAPSSHKLEDNGRQYRGMSLLEIGRDLLEARGIKTRGMTRTELAIRALSTSDFPNILANVARKSLGKVFASADRTFLPLANQTSFTDFKPRKVVALGDAPALVKVPEGAEITYGSIGEKGEVYALATYARIVQLTREMLINDDLGVFARIPRMFAMSAAILENELAWLLVTANTDGVVMGDGKQLFHNDHANTSGGALGITGLSNARKVMRAQTSIDGKKMRLRPANLIVPSAHETLAQQLVADITPSQVGEHNPFAHASRFDNVIVEPLLDDKSALEYYLTANPDQVDVLEYGYLEGQEGPYIETREGFEREGVEIKCRHDFAVAFLDHRGVVRSSGA